MNFLWFIHLVLVLSSAPRHYFHHDSHTDLAKAIQRQRKISVDVTLANISPPGARKGAVVAAQSKKNPDYWFHWVRDAALVINTIVSLYEETNNPKYEQIIWDYISFTNVTQFRHTRSSCAEDPMGFGEPKYHVDGTPFMKDWGRPQYDGLAHRVSTLVRFAKIYLRRGGSLDRVQSILYRGMYPPRSVIKKDLEVLWKVVDKPGFDLWEETWGIHYYTLKMQHHALVKGYELANEMSDYGASEWYYKQSQYVAAELSASHWWSGRYIYSTSHPPPASKPTNLDMSVILSVLHSLDSDPDRPTYAATLYALKRAMKYPINNQYRPDLRPSLGRYAEDTYYGGNPWFLTTLAVAEFQYRMYVALRNRARLVITRVNRDFFEDVVGHSVRLGVQSRAQFQEIMRMLLTDADSYLSRVHCHIGADGRMDEQIDKYTGFQVSAVQLTWNHVAYLNTVMARDEAMRL